MLSFSSLLLPQLNFGKLLHTSQVSFGNHYDVLKLQRHCTTKEVREAFLHLSKKYHPDLNRHKEAHKRFVEVNEAYKVLSNPSSRQNYDLGLIPHRGAYRDVHASDEPYMHDRWKDPSFYENRDKSQDKHYADRPYYGIKGVGKVSNFTIMCVCLAVTAVGVGLQVLAIRKSLAFRREQLIRRSQEYDKEYNRLRNVALQEKDNELQLKLLEQRLRKEIKVEINFWKQLFMYFEKRDIFNVI